MPDPEPKDSVVFLLTELLKETRRSNDAKAVEGTREILSLSEAAEYLGMAEGTLRDWVRMRRVPFCKINGTIKFRRSKLDRWIDKNEVALLE